MGRTLAIGVSYLGLGTPGDGVPATTFKQQTHIEQNTLAFNFSEPTIRQFNIEGSSEPWAVIVAAGGEADSIDWVIPSPTNEELVDICGGEIVNGEWKAPTETPDITKSLCIRTNPYQGKQVQYTYAIGKIFARPNQAPTEENGESYIVRFVKQAAYTANGVKMSPYGRKIMDVEDQSGSEGSGTGEV